MTDPLSPALQIWPYSKAPAELLAAYREVHGECGDEELCIFVPAELIDKSGKISLPTAALWFLNRLPKYSNHEQYAGDDWGWFAMTSLNDNARLVIMRRCD